MENLKENIKPRPGDIVELIRGGEHIHGSQYLPISHEYGLCIEVDDTYVHVLSKRCGYTKNPIVYTKVVQDGKKEILNFISEKYKDWEEND